MQLFLILVRHLLKPSHTQHKQTHDTQTYRPVGGIHKHATFHECGRDPCTVAQHTSYSCIQIPGAMTTHWQAPKAMRLQLQVSPTTTLHAQPCMS